MQHSSPLKASQMNPEHCEHEALSPGNSQSPLHCPHLAAGEIWWRCHILLFGYISLWELQIPRGTGRSAWLCICTASETWLAGRGR